MAEGCASRRLESFAPARGRRPALRALDVEPRVPEKPPRFARRSGLARVHHGELGGEGVGCGGYSKGRRGMGSNAESSAAHGQHGEPPRSSARLERQLATAQQITHMGSWEWDLASNIVRWSDELYRIYGLEPQSMEITFEVFSAKLHPEDREHVHEAVRRALESGGRFAYCERIFRPTGEMRYLDTVGEALHDSEGKAVGLIGTCRDVTAEHQRDETIRLYADIVQNVQIGLSVWKPAAGASHGMSLLAFNPASERAAGISLAGCIGRDLGDIFAGLSNTELPELLREVARDGKGRELPKFRFVSPSAIRQTFAATAFPLPGAAVGLALEDVTQQTRARELQAAEQRVLELVASGAELGPVLTELILAIEKHVPHTLASILLIDAEARTVHVGAAPHLPASFSQAIDGEPIGPAAGACGTAAYLKKAVFSRDIASDPLWEKYRDVALSHGLRACWSSPILSSEGHVLGTFALYYREAKGPDTDELELIARATHVAGIAIQRKQLDDRLRALTGHVEAVREEERTAMAREIHDELGQALTAMKMDVAWIGRHVQSGQGSTLPAALDGRISALSSMIDAVINQVRRISADLRPGVLDDLGLAAAIEWQTRDFEARSGIKCGVCSNVEDTRFERGLSTAVFRIFQEALTNVARHAHASHVDVSLLEEAGRLRLEIQDDGRGITSDMMSRPRSLGLLGMHERAHRLGGALSVISNPGEGTLIVVNMPIHREAVP
jgi:PAS domain S-box-containing protein